MIINKVFVIMPFSQQTLVMPDETRHYPEQHFKDLYQIIKNAVGEYREAIDVGRADDTKSGNILTTVVKRVYEADLVIAVLTAKNPNVFWELGLRHSLRKGTMMLLARRDEVPFDLHGYYSHEYSIEGYERIEELKRFITDRLREYEDQSLQAVPIDDSPVLDILQRAEYDQFNAWNLIERRRAVLVLLGLIREYQAMRGVAREAIGDAREYFDKASFVPREIAMSFDILDGFVRTRPLVGLSDDAYVDAVRIVSMSTEFLAEWERFVGAIRDERGAKVRKSERKDRAAEMQNIAGSLIVSMNLFLTDLIDAMEYVLVKKDAWNIPWGNRLDSLEETFPVDELPEMERGIEDSATRMFANLTKFYAEISGTQFEAP